MPTKKDFKRLARARMRKTGEAYTTARAQLLDKKQVPAPPDYARLAGRSRCRSRCCTAPSATRADGRVGYPAWI